MRAGQSLGIGVLFLIASAVAFPGLVAGVEDAWSWFTKDEIFQGIVSESQPLFIGPAGWDAANAVLRLSRFVWVFPISLLGLAWHARRSDHRPALLLLIFSATALAAATLLQRRFFNSFSPLFAIIVAWSCIEVVHRLTRALHAGGRLARAGVVGAASIAGLWLFAPTLAAYRVPIENLRKPDDALLTVSRPELARRRMLEAAEWLGDHTPPTSGYLDADSSPEYGVLAPWGYGHLLKYVAQRPTVVGNFGDDVGEGNLRRVEAYLRSAEHDASPILDSLNARYVVVETLARAAPARLERDTMRSRLSQDDSPGLERHRLLWESSLDGRPRTPRSELRIFEHVRGAVIDGVAPPGARVRAALEYTSNRGRHGTFETSAVAGPEGRYRLRVPYSTRGAPPGVTTRDDYRIVSGGRTASVSIEEAAVEQGLSVEGPAFVADSPR